MCINMKCVIHHSESQGIHGWIRQLNTDINCQKGHRVTIRGLGKALINASESVV